MVIKAFVLSPIETKPSGGLIWIAGPGPGVEIHVGDAHQDGASITNILQPAGGEFSAVVVPGADPNHVTIVMTPKTTAVAQSTSGMSQICVSYAHSHARKIPIWGMIIVRGDNKKP